MLQLFVLSLSPFGDWTEQLKLVDLSIVLELDQESSTGVLERQVDHKSSP